MILLQAAQDTAHAYAVSPMGRMGEKASGIIDYVIVLTALIAVVISTVLMVRWLVRPGEDAPDHIKRLILDDPPTAPATIDRRSWP
jgi:hypothetical protein